MNAVELRDLAERAATVEGRSSTRLVEVHARIRSARRRRQVGAVVACVIAVLLVLAAGTAVGKLTATTPPPAEPPPPAPTGTPQPDDEMTTTRQLVWAKGDTVHVGDRRIDVGGRVWEVQATDGGAVFIRQAHGDCGRYAAGCNELWFTDGNEVAHIGTVYGSVIRGYHFLWSVDGSIAVWFEPSPKDHPHGSGYAFSGEWVVYDVQQRREVARMDSPGKDTDADGHPHLLIEQVFDDYVYWTPDDRDPEWCRKFSRPGVVCARHRAVMRLDTATGTQTKVPWSTYVTDRLNRLRMFFPSTYEPDFPYNAFPGEHPGAETVGFHREGDRLVPDFYGGSGPVNIRRAGKLERVRLRMPVGYPRDGTSWSMPGWLDDGRVVLQAEHLADLLVCRLPDGRCRIAVRGVDQADFGSHG